MGVNFEDRQPTEAEYEGLQIAAQQWVLDTLQSAYSGETDFAVTAVLS